MWNKILEILDPYQACKEYAEERDKYAVHIPWYKRLLGYCPWCERYFRYRVRTVHRNTAYVEQSKNWITACESCREDDYEYYAELWNDYYSGLL